MTPPNGKPTEHISPTHKGLADLADLLNALPSEKVIIVRSVAAPSATLAAQVRQAILSGAGGIGPQ